MENDISLKLLEISKFTTKIKGLDEDLKNLDQEIRDKASIYWLLNYFQETYKISLLLTMIGNCFTLISILVC